MQALEVREKFASYMANSGYLKLREHPIVNTTQPGIFFNGSALTPNLEYFLNNKQRASSQLFTQQRVFLARNAESLTHLPLFSIFQVMMSFYQFNEENLGDAFDHGLVLLTEVLGIPKSDLILLVPKDHALCSMIARRTVNPIRLVEWKTPPQFNVNKLLTGFYLKIFLRYKHGVIPLWDIIHVNQPNHRIHIDSCLLLERVTFILQQCDTWYQTELFLPLIRLIEQKDPALFGHDRFGYLLANMARSIICSLADGVEPSHKGPGYVVKKIIRGVLKDKFRRQVRTTLPELVAPGLECLRNVGYQWDCAQDRIAMLLEKEERAYQEFIRTEERFLRKQIQLYVLGKKTHFAMDDLLAWKDSQGISEDTACDFLMHHGIQVEGRKVATQRPRNKFFSDGYPFDPSATVGDPIVFIKNLES